MWCGRTKRYVSTTEGAAGSSTGTGMLSRSWGWEQDTKQENKGSALCQKHQPLCPAALCSPHPFRRGNWERKEGVRVETHLWASQRTFHLAGVATPRKYGCSFADIIFGGNDLMDQSGYAPSVVLLQLFVLLCCQTDQETALKQQHPPLLSYFYPGSVPRHNSPCLH